VKGQWEDRVKLLLAGLEIVWYFKAPDSPGYGGKPRIDFIACDILGRCIVIEVKSLPANRKSFTPNTLVPPVQQDILNRVGESANGCAILAVGVGTDSLFLYNWRTICQQGKVGLDATGPAFQTLEWTGPKKWATQNLYQMLIKSWRYEPSFWAGLPLPNSPAGLTLPPLVLYAKSREEVLATPSTPSVPPPKEKPPAILLTPANSKPIKRLEETLTSAVQRAEAARAARSATTTTNAPSEQPSPDTAPSPSTLKQPGSLSTRRKALLLAQRSSRSGKTPSS